MPNQIYLLFLLLLLPPLFLLLFLAFRFYFHLFIFRRRLCSAHSILYTTFGPVRRHSFCSESRDHFCVCGRGARIFFFFSFLLGTRTPNAYTIPLELCVVVDVDVCAPALSCRHVYNLVLASFNFRYDARKPQLFFAWAISSKVSLNCKRNWVDVCVWVVGGRLCAIPTFSIHFSTPFFLNVVYTYKGAHALFSRSSK